MDIYHSTVLPTVRAYSDLEKRAAQWADAQPVVWDIVTQTQSAVFGRGGALHHDLGIARHTSDSTSALRRAVAVYSEAHAKYGHPLWPWRLDFTLTHYRDPGFATARFYTRDYQPQSYRCCLELDYTPATLAEVAAQFRQWAQDYRPYVVALGLVGTEAGWLWEWTEGAALARWRWVAGTHELEALDATARL